MATTSGTNTGSVIVTTTTKTTEVVNNTTNITSTATANTTTISETAYSYMRAKAVDITVVGLKPNTQYYPFFNKVDVSAYCSMVDGQVSSTLKTNALGELKGKFYIPANRFLCGSYTFSLVDNRRNIGNNVYVPDPIYGQADAQYEANGVLKTQQTQITINSTVNTTTTVNSVNTTTTNVDVNINSTTPTPPVTPPAVVQCEVWYFEYAVTSGSQTRTFTVTTNSVTPPPTTSIDVRTGAQNAGVAYSSTILSSIQYISTSTGTTSNTWNHTFAGRTSAGGTAGSVKKYRQEWVGTTTETRPSITGWRPSGLASSDTVTILTNWTRGSTTVCPTTRGLGAATLVTTTSVAPYDPIAQSFYVDADRYPQGICVTSVGVYFRTVDQSTPVFVELRNMVNGLPGSQVFPGGVAYVSGYAASQSYNATMETVFRFDHPIYLQPSQEYCFVVKSPSLGYNMWCSKLGEIDVTTGKVIDANPYTGTLFLSENNYTWLPDPTQDVKFNLYIAEFDISKTANIVARPHADSGKTLYYGTAQNLPLSFLSTTKGSDTVTASIPMHGLSTGDTIIIEGISATPTSYNNILVADLNASHIVTVIDEDTVTFDVSTNANKTGPLSASDTRLPISIAPPVSLTEDAFVNAQPVINADNRSPSTIPVAQTLIHPAAPSVDSVNSFTVYTNVQVNEVMIDYLNTELDQTTIDEYISIATGKSTAGSETPYSYQPYESMPSEKGFYSFDEPRLLATPANETIHTTELLANKSATVNIRMSSNNKNISPFVDVTGMSLMTKTYVIDNQNDELDSLTLETEFNDPTLNSEINPGTGNALAKYKTAARSLTAFHNKVTVFVTANCPNPAIIDAYVRTSADRETHQDHDWVWAPINGVFGTAFANSNDKLVTNEWMYEVTAAEPFNVYDIKLVMRTTNNSIIPKIYGVRTITQFA